MPDSEPVPRGTFFCFSPFACLDIGFQLSNFSFTKFQLWLLNLRLSAYSAFAVRHGHIATGLVHPLSLMDCTMSRAPLQENVVI